ncbi:helix-turn-helix transcriptional regulator [Dermacoccaceae bacterium W4C1]
MTAVHLQLAALDLTADDVVESIASNKTLRALAWKKTSNITTMTVFASAGNVVADTIAAVRCAHSAGFTVLRVYEDRTNIGEITRRLGGLSREAVRKWTAEPSFPEPRTAQNNDGARGASKVWDWAEVANWVQENKGLALDEDLPTEAQVAEINAALCGVTDYASDDVHRMLFANETHVAASVYRTDISRYTSFSVKTAGWAVVTSPNQHSHNDDTVGDVEYA